MNGFEKPVIVVGGTANLAGRLQTAFQDHGFSSIAHPMLEIDLLSTWVKPTEKGNDLITPAHFVFKNNDIFIFTSANAVESLRKARFPRNGTRAICVGQSTAKAAKYLGIEEIQIADGNVESLVALAQAYLNVKKYRLIYIRGKHISDDLKRHLQHNVSELVELITYESKFVKSFSDAYIALRNENLPAILICFSPLGFASYLANCHKFKIEPVNSHHRLLFAFKEKKGYSSQFITVDARFISRTERNDFGSLLEAVKSSC